MSAESERQWYQEYCNACPLNCGGGYKACREDCNVKDKLEPKANKGNKRWELNLTPSMK